MPLRIGFWLAPTAFVLTTLFSVGHGAQQKVEDLIQQLGDSSFKKREEAKRQLLLREDAAALLQKALDGVVDLEIAQRARAILQELEKRKGLRWLQRLHVLAKAGKIEQVAELLGAWPAGLEEEACWKALCELTRTLQLHFKPGGRDYPDIGAIFPLPPKVMVGPRINKIPLLKVGESLFLRAGRLDDPLGRLDRGIVCASGSVHVCFVGPGAIFAAGSVEIMNVASGTVIVCGGDVKFESACSHCLVIARGSITSEAIGNCHLISGKAIVCTTPRAGKCVEKENEPTPLNFVQWFDVAREGLTVEAAVGGVKVKTVDDGKPFGKAGVRAGDLIVEVETEAASSPDVFRQLLRRALTGDQGVRLRVVRGSKAIQLVLPSPWAKDLISGSKK